MKNRSVVFFVNLLVLITMSIGDTNTALTRYTGRLMQYFLNFMVDGGGDLVSLQYLKKHHFRDLIFFATLHMYLIWWQTFLPTFEGEIEAVARLHGCLTGYTLVVSF